MVRSATTRSLSTFVVLVLLAMGMASSAHAQTQLVLSSNSDFSTDDRLFEADDTLYIRAVVPGIDLTAVEESHFEIEPNGDGEDVSGNFEIDFDTGVFTAFVPLAELEGTARQWTVEVEIEQENGPAFATRTQIVIEGLSEDPRTVTFTGTVQTATATEITVAGRTIAVTDETNLAVAGGGTLAAEDLAGRKVRVVVHQVDGVLTARLILVTGSAEGELRLTGPIEAVSTVDSLTTIVVGGVTFTIDANTEVDGDLAVGAVAEVEAIRSADGWLATEVDVRSDDEDEADEQELTGPVSEVGDTYLVVADLRFEVDGDTDFDGVNELAELTVGTVVEIEFIQRTDGTLLALEVETGDGEDDEDEEDEEEEREEVEIEGTIAAVTADSIQVGDVTFAITAETEIEGDDVELTAADLYAGLEVEIEGFRQDDGTLVATSIEVEDGLDTELDVNGEVTARTDSTITVGGTTFLVDAETEIEGERGESATLADIEVGTFVEAELDRLANGTYVASKLEVERLFEEDDVEVTGRISAISAGSITVSGQTFTLSPTVEITDRNEATIDFGALAVDQVVKVEGYVADDGTLVATEIKAAARLHSEGRVRGAITALDGSTFSVAGVQLQAGAQTRFEDLSGLAALALGQSVSVRFRVLGNGTRFVLKIEAEDGDAGSVSLRSTIDSIAGDTVFVAGVAVAVTAQTQIVGEDGATITVQELAAGQTVEVEGVQAANVIVADEIEVEDAIVLSSAVSAVQDGRLTLSGLDVAVTNETLIVGQGNTALTLQDIQAGAFVEVIATSQTSTTPGEEDTYEAERVLVQQQTAGTGTERELETPTAFRLEGNYPNPFNPSTTIVFEIRSGAAETATLTIYNLLGQQVRSLVGGGLAPGRHRITWDGQDDHGRSAASGVYLYRLRVGDQVETRSMTLIK